MCRAMEELIQEEFGALIHEEKVESEAKGKLIAYSEMIEDGAISIEKAATMLGLTVEALQVELSNLQT